MLPSISTTRRGNLFCLTKSIAVGSLNTRYCRIWMPMRTPLPSSSSNWKMKAGSATTRSRNQPSRSFKKPNSAPSLFDRRENIRDNFAARFGAEIAFAVNADADCTGVHVAFSDNEHSVHFHLLGPLDFPVDLVAALVDLGADLMRAQLVQDRQ